jgi:hypothetical protein
MRSFVVERELPGIGSVDNTNLQKVMARSQEVLAQLAPDIEWVRSYITDNKIFCIFLANDEGAIRRHAELTGLPINKITEITRVLDPAADCGPI